MQTANSAAHWGRWIYTQLQNGAGQWVFLGVVVFLLFKGRVGAFLRGFKRFRVGNAIVGVEAETHENKDTVLFCPHEQCRAARDRAIEEMAKQMSCLEENNARLTEAIEKIGLCMSEIQRGMQATSKKLDDLTVDQLKLVFYNKEMPAAERLISGLRYIEKGYNHEMKYDTIDMALKNPDMYSAVVAAVPSLRLKEADTKIIQEARGG